MISTGARECHREVVATLSGEVSRGSARPSLPDGPGLVLGLGEAGQAAVRALAARRGAECVRVWDDSQSNDVRAARRSLAAMGVSIPVDEERALDGAGFVVKSPGVPLENSMLEAASRADILVVDELELAWRMSSWPVAAVTGTNGKSTTATL